MERQVVSINNSPLESSLMDLVLNTESEKIRRPPNAFMLFARDHRRLVSKQHPDVSNKGVSSILGQIWKSTSDDVKEKYYKKAKILGDLHKRRYPDYVYSPRDARIQKMNKKKKKDEVNSTDSTTQKANLAAVRELTKRDDNKNEEEWIKDPNNDPKSSPEYIPNNPEYFAEQSPEEDESSDLRPRSGYQESDDINLQMDQGWTEKNCDCCNQNRLGSGLRCAPPCEKLENERVVPRFPDHIPCSYATASPFCSPPPHFTGPMSSYCCGPRPCTSPIPRPYGPPLHPYWNPSPCYPGREYFCEDLKPYPFPTPYHVPDFYGTYGYFDRPLRQPKQNLDTGFHPHLRGNPEFFRRDQDGSEADSYSYFSRPDVKVDNVHRSFDSCLRTEDEVAFQNRRILRSNVKNQEEMVHQNQANRIWIRPQDESSSHTSMPMSEESSFLAERRHFNSHFYPNLWDSHYAEGKSPRIASIDSISKEQYQCDSTKNNEYQNSSDLANNCPTQSKDVLSPTFSLESHKRKFDALHAEDNDEPVTSTNPKLYRLSTLPTSEATRPHLCSSVVEESSLTTDNIQEMFNKPVAMLDQPVYTNTENTMSVTSSNKHLSNTNKISPNCIIGTHHKNRSGDITVDQRGVPLNLIFSKVPIQMTKECSKEFNSSDLQNNQIPRKSHDTSANVQRSQIYKPLVKMEFNDQNISSIDEINEKNSCNPNTY